GVIKIIGEVGSGKTLICRKLLHCLEEDFFTAYIPNPDLSPLELRRAFARELGIHLTLLQDQHELLTTINNRLVELCTAGKKVVLILDEAQAIPLESLEAIRLLTNLETEKAKLLQVVLFGQPELDSVLNQPHFRQLKQRITFSYYLSLLSREELDTYLFHRLAVAGYTYGILFTKRARNMLFKSSRGVPRIVNVLCHKALLLAYGRGERVITHKMLRLAVEDTEAAVMPSRRRLYLIFFLAFGLVLGLIFMTILQKGMI
ncbi:MAG TPA: AAA family ATPase, partial [Gammaproteobacteria bacterium]|nr:AAA family ATPase [Gammaproteobacteria bacterium]